MDAIESRYTVQGWEDVETLTRHWVGEEELGYILVVERGSGERADDIVERLDISSRDSDDALMAALAPEGVSATADYCDRVLDQIKAAMLRHMVGVETCRFRVKWMGLKGGTVLNMRTVAVTDGAKDLPVPAAPLPGLSTHAAELRSIQHAGEVRERLDSHDFTRRGQELVLTGVGHLVGLHNDLSLRSSNVLNDYRNNADAVIQSLRQQVDKMASERDQAYATLRQSLHERDQELTRRAEVDANRDAMNRAIDRSLDVISDAVELAVASKLDVDKEVLPALKMLAGSPLANVLKDKRALELLSRPDIQQMLSGLIMDAVEAAEVPDPAPADSGPSAGNAPPADDSDTPTNTTEGGRSSETGDAMAETQQPPQTEVARPSVHPIPTVPTDFLETSE